jgi:2-dehydropantoate 2-reductase
MVEGPAAVQVMGRQRLVIGALRQWSAPRIATLAQVLRGCGIAVEETGHIMDEVWNKVALNLATNPLSVVTGAGLGKLCSDAKLVPIVLNILDETWQVASRYNARPQMTRKEMLERGRSAGDFRTSMLEDYLKGRQLELSSIADAVFELGARMELNLPISRTIVNMARFQTQQRG